MLCSVSGIGNTDSYRFFRQVRDRRLAIPALRAFLGAGFCVQLFRGESSSTNDWETPQMFRVAALVALVATLTACDMFSTLTEGSKYAKAVESDQSTGMKPQVGFNWHDGRLETVTVLFPPRFMKQDRLAQ